MKNPNTEPNAMASRDCLRSALVGSRLRMPFGTSKIGRSIFFSALSSTSPTANNPTLIAMNSMPSNRAGTPKVSRCWPVKMSMPMVDTSSPMHIERKPLMGDSLASRITSSRPKAISAAYSGGPKPSARFATNGAAKVRAITPKVLAMNPAIADIPIAGPARPLRANGCPSRHSTTDEVSPGMFNRIDVVAPANFAPW
jgi:hypothetical protein